MGKTITEDVLYELAKNLLAQVVVDGRAWPCANISLSVGGFEDGVTGNKGIGSFLVRGEEAKALNSGAALFREDSGEQRRTETPPPGKRRKVEGGISAANIHQVSTVLTQLNRLCERQQQRAERKK